MARVDETACRPVGPAVGVVRGEEVDAVVAPAAVARELGHRHELDGVDAQLDEVVEVLDDAVERALRCERADVELVEHGAGQGQASPAAVGPGERRVVDDGRQPVDAVGLRSGERGSGRGGPPSSEKAYRVPAPACSTAARHHPPSDRHHGLASSRASSSSTAVASGAQTPNSTASPSLTAKDGDGELGERDRPPARGRRRRAPVSTDRHRPAGRSQRGAFQSPPVRRGTTASKPSRAKASTSLARRPAAVIAS